MEYKLFNLKDVIFRNTVGVFLIPILLLVISMIFLYMYQMKEITSKEEQIFIEQFHASIQNNLENKKTETEYNLGNIETNLIGIQDALQNYYSNPIRDVNNQKFEFKKNERGFLYKPNQHKGSNVVFMPQANPTSQDLKDAYNLEKIDSFIIPLVDRNNIIMASWMNMENYLVRYYPHFDIKNILEPTMDIKAFNFYYEADPKHNPKKQNIWTTPYLDPAMKGWMISHVSPIYKEDTFLGVFGIDINIEAILSTLPKTYNSQVIKTFITNSKGDVLSMSNQLREYFDLVKLKDYKDGKSLSDEIILPNSYNILKTSNIELSNQIKSLLSSNASQSINHKNKKFYIYKTKITNTQWFLFYMVDESKLLHELNKIQSENLKLAMFTLVVLILVFLALMINLNKNLKQSIKRISEPIEKLSEATKHIKNLKLDNNENILEISNLYESFKIMADEINEHNADLENKIKERTKDLNEKILTIEKLQEKLIDQNIHDHLTQLFNRRYGDDVLRRESQKALSESTTLTIVIIDIDYFKQVNDTYGHQVGDSVLVKLSKILQSNIRSRDIAVRYGGEEFLLIFPDCTKEEASIIIESIKKDYTKDMTEVMNLKVGTTLSAGISSLPQDSVSIEEVLKYADDALYSSKNQGRDIITIFKTDISAKEL